MSSLPVGTVIGMIGQDPNNPPAGWLYCDGSGFDGDRYPELSKILSNNLLPNLVGLTLMGASQGSPYPPSDFGDGGGESQNPDGTYGSATHTLSLTEMPSHQHFGFGEAYSDWPLGVLGPKGQPGSHGGKDEDDYYYGTTFTGGATSNTSSVQANAAFSLMQPSYAIYFFICASSMDTTAQTLIAEVLIER